MIRMWFFVEYVVAQRASKNCLTGSIETKSINVYNKTFMKMVINNLLPAIKEKWLTRAREKINIQMDNVPAHKKSNKNAQIIVKLEENAARG